MNKFNKICAFITFGALAIFFAVYAIGNLDGNTKCYGQTFVSGVFNQRKVVTDFKVDGMKNHDVSRDFKIWFAQGLILSIYIPISLLMMNKKRIYMYIATFSFVFWLTIGAIWRFRDWGE